MFALDIMPHLWRVGDMNELLHHCIFNFMHFCEIQLRNCLFLANLIN